MRYFAKGKDIPNKARGKTYYYMNYYCMSLYDAFNCAVRENLAECSEELQLAWYESDFRKYIPSAYLPEYL